MSLDPHLWDALERHGVTQEHLVLLLRFLELQRNGSWSWNYVHGNVTQCDARVVFPSRRLELSRLAHDVQGLGGEVDGASVVR